MKEINPSLFPPGGYTFFDSDGVRHVGNSVEELADSLAAYRKRAGRPPGDPVREINEAMCAAHPSYCYEATDPEPAFSGRALATVVVSRLSALFTDGAPPLAPETEVKTRTSICWRCPLNVDWESHCPPCKKKAAEILSLIVRPRKPVAALKGCACLAAQDDLSVAVQLAAPRPAENNPPPDCWRKAT